MNISRIVGAVAVALAVGIASRIDASDIVAARAEGTSALQLAGDARAHQSSGEDSRGMWSIATTVSRGDQGLHRGP
jgi:hypothetical protein